MSELAKEILCGLGRGNPCCNFALASGRTPKWRMEDKIFSNLKTSILSRLDSGKERRNLFRDREQISLCPRITRPTLVLATKSMETMVSAVEFSDWVSNTMEAGMSRVKFPGSKLITGGSVAMIRTMKGWDKM